MTNQQILEKAIQKAIDGGWKDGQAIGVYTLEKNKRGTYGLRSVSDGWINVEAVIFNHDFAKALWGETTMDWHHWPTREWQYHLQQMVIADDPIKYLGEYLGDL